MASDFLNTTFRDASVAISNPHGGSYVGLENVQVPPTVEVGIEHEGVSVRWEDFPIYSHVTAKSFKCSLAIANTALTGGGLELAFPGLATGNFDTAVPLFVGVQIVAAIDARQGTDTTLTITAPYCLVTSSGSTEMGNQVHTFGLSFEAHKLNTSTAPVSIAVS